MTHPPQSLPLSPTSQSFHPRVLAPGLDDFQKLYQADSPHHAIHHQLNHRNHHASQDPSTNPHDPNLSPGQQPRFYPLIEAYHQLQPILAHQHSLPPTSHSHELPLSPPLTMNYPPYSPQNPYAPPSSSNDPSQQPPQGMYQPAPGQLMYPSQPGQPMMGLPPMVGMGMMQRPPSSSGWDNRSSRDPYGGDSVLSPASSTRYSNPPTTSDGYSYPHSLTSHSPMPSLSPSSMSPRGPSAPGQAQGAGMLSGLLEDMSLGGLGAPGGPGGMMGMGGPGMGGMGGGPGMGMGGMGGNMGQGNMGGGPGKDDIIPTAIVIKNIPFAVQKETLLAVIESLSAPLPYAFNYHHDNGVFRGLAFANFRHPHEADAVVVALNGYDISGRKLRVEYKKVLQAGEKERIEREKAIKRMRSMQFGGGGGPDRSGHHQGGQGGGGYGGAMGRQGGWNDPMAGMGGLGVGGYPQQERSVSGPGGMIGMSGILGAVGLGGGMGLPGVVSPHSGSLPPPTPGYGTNQRLDSLTQSLPASVADGSPTTGAFPASNGSAAGQSDAAQTDAALPTSVDFNDPTALEIYSKVLVFKEDRMRDELSFSKGLNARERKIVYLVAAKLALFHCEVGEGDEKHAVVTRTENDKTNLLKKQSISAASVNSPAGAYLSPYPQQQSVDRNSADEADEDSDSTSPGLKLKNSMPNMNNLTGPANTAAASSRLVPQRSSGNLRDFSTIPGANASRRSFAGANVNTTGAAAQGNGPASATTTFNSLFGAPIGLGDASGPTLGNGTSFEPSPSPTSPTLTSEGAMSPPAHPGLYHSTSSGLLRNPRGPPAEPKGFGSRSLRSIGGSNGNLRGAAATTPTGTSPGAIGAGAGGVIGGQRLSVSAGSYTGSNGINVPATPTSAGATAVGGQALSLPKSDSNSIHTSGSSSSVIEEENDMLENFSEGDAAELIKV